MQYTLSWVQRIFLKRPRHDMDGRLKPTKTVAQASPWGACKFSNTAKNNQVKRLSPTWDGQLVDKSDACSSNSCTLSPTSYLALNVYRITLFGTWYCKPQLTQLRRRNCKFWKLDRLSTKEYRHWTNTLDIKNTVRFKSVHVQSCHRACHSVTQLRAPYRRHSYSSAIST